MLVSRQESILVVEDNDDSREFVSEFLTANGFLVKGAANGKVALEEIERSGGRLALILLDLSMPVMDGWTFLRHRQQDARLNEIPVVVMTGEGFPMVPDVGAVLIKPLDLGALLLLIKRLVLKHIASPSASRFSSEL
jgi:CheY-like chemotaxis protein